MACWQSAGTCLLSIGSRCGQALLNLAVWRPIALSLPSLAEGSCARGSLSLLRTALDVAAQAARCCQGRCANIERAVACRATPHARIIRGSMSSSARRLPQGPCRKSSGSELIVARLLCMQVTGPRVRPVGRGPSQTVMPPTTGRPGRLSRPALRNKSVGGQPRNPSCD